MLTGKLVHLRLLEANDLALLARWRNDPDAFRWFSSAHLIAESEQADWYERYRRDATQRQWMIEKLGGDTVGTLALMNIDHHHQSAEVGRVLINGEQRGRGYAREATKLLTDYAFNELNLQRLWLVVFSDNARALAFYEACGFCVEGVQRRAAWKAGAFRDLIMMALLREA